MEKWQQCLILCLCHFDKIYLQIVLKLSFHEVLSVDPKKKCTSSTLVLTSAAHPLMLGISMDVLPVETFNDLFVLSLFIVFDQIRSVIVLRLLLYITTSQSNIRHQTLSKSVPCGSFTMKLHDYTLMFNIRSLTNRSSLSSFEHDHSGRAYERL